MTMQTDVLSATATADGIIVAGPARIKGILLTTTTSAGSVVLKDGGASGTTRVTLNTPAVAEMFNALLPGEGIRFTSDVYVDVTNVSSVTVFYG
jgi:hypothetical protein